MARTIILPKVIRDRLNTLTKLKEETNGVLFYRRQGDECPIEGLYMTGVGNVGHVDAKSDKVKIANKFLESNPDYKFVKFHVHTQKTIEQFGVEYARNFSTGDISYIEKQIAYHPEFIEMLVTPETILLKGKDEPILRLVNRSETYEQNHRNIDSSLARIAQELGIENEILKGTMKIR